MKTYSAHIYVQNNVFYEDLTTKSLNVSYFVGTIDKLSYTFHLFQIACLSADISPAFLPASIIIDLY